MVPADCRKLALSLLQGGSYLLKKVLIGVGGAIGVIILLIVVIAVIANTGGDSSSKIAQDNEQFRQEQEEKRKGFHCLSAWDGNHDGFEELVKANLKDPGSMETYETRISPVNTTTGQHSIIMDFGARNSFGGMARHTATGWVDNETCEATLLNVE